MTAIITNKFRIRSAKDFIENVVGHPRMNPLTNLLNITGTTQDELSVSLAETYGSHAVDRNMYVFIGKSLNWDNDLIPPVPTDDIVSLVDVRENILGLKLVDNLGGSLVIPRFNWDATGITIYKQFDNTDPDLLTDMDHPHYCITDEYHVFKCLGNNGGSVSTIRPERPATAPFIHYASDGYVWKYMTTVNGYQADRFLTDRWIPVKKLLENDGSIQWQVQQAAETSTGMIESCIIENAGDGYNALVSEIIGGAGTTYQLLDGSALANVYAGSILYLLDGSGQSREIIAYDEVTKTVTLVDSLNMNPGDQIEIMPKITVTGNGSLVNIKANVETTGINQGKLTSVSILNAGEEYTYASIVVSGGAPTINAEIRPIVSAVYGHGSDIEKELGAFFAMLNIKLQFDEGGGDFPLSNDYRQIGLIRDLKDYNTEELATISTRRAIRRMHLSSVAGTFVGDEVISGTSGTETMVGYVVDFDSNTNILSYLQNSDSGMTLFTAGMNISSASGSASISSIDNPECDIYSGELLYYENRRPVLRSPDQIEDIKIVVEF